MRRVQTEEAVMGSFLVSSYKMLIGSERWGGNYGYPLQTTSYYNLEIFGVVSGRASIGFASDWLDYAADPRALGIVKTSSDLETTVFAQLPTEEFSLWHEVLRSEKPLTLFYRYSFFGGPPF